MDLINVVKLACSVAAAVSSVRKAAETCEIRMDRVENGLVTDNLTEQQRSAEKKTKRPKRFKTAGIVLKYLELLGGSVCIYLLRYYSLLYAYESLLYLFVITTGGFIMISGMLLLGSSAEHGNVPGQEFYFNLVGTAMYVLTAVASIYLYLKFSMFFVTIRVGLVFGALCVGMGLLYLVDTWVASRRKPDDVDDLELSTLFSI